MAMLRAAVWRELPQIPDNKTDVRPLLTTAAQVQQLTRDEARQNYPAKIRGVESQGMLLAAKDGKDLKLITVDGPFASGATVG